MRKDSAASALSLLYWCKKRRRLTHKLLLNNCTTADKLRPSLGAIRPTIMHNLGELPAAVGSESSISGGVPVGVPNEDRNGFEWMSEKAFCKKYASKSQVQSSFSRPQLFLFLQ
eukprot:COSAG02_NODE_2594_length_8461_cov_189.802320_3_plen_114_part_00